MASCAYCNTTLLFGGKKQGGLRFCNDSCEIKGNLATAGSQLPQAEVSLQMAKLHAGSCPNCQGPGPVDVHTSYRVWSALLMTQWVSRPLICCQGCGTKRKLGDALFSVLLGWWGFPWGLLVTPLQVGRNLFGLVTAPDPASPSPALEQMLRIQMAAQALTAARTREVNG